jgi:3-oxoacyl-[acyl-carrier protein] reductase
MELGLKDKVAIVTGSTRGIGLATARAFAKEGMKVIVNGTKPDKVAEIVQELQAEGLTVDGRAADVADDEQMRALIDFTLDRFGGLDVMVNNAGISYAGRILDTPNKEWKRVVEVNLYSVYLGGKLAAQVMKERGGGVILNASSFAAVLPVVGGSAYGAAKEAVINLTRTMAAEWGPFNIRVNAYLPGVIVTDMTAAARQALGEEMLNQLALHRFGDVEEMAEPLVFLASRAARYITGTTLEVSGGKFVVQIPGLAWK